MTYRLQEGLPNDGWGIEPLQEVSDLSAVPTDCIDTARALLNTPNFRQSLLYSWGIILPDKASIEYTISYIFAIAYAKLSRGLKRDMELANQLVNEGLTRKPTMVESMIPTFRKLEYYARSIGFSSSADKVLDQLASIPDPIMEYQRNVRLEVRSFELVALSFLTKENKARMCFPETVSETIVCIERSFGNQNFVDGMEQPPIPSRAVDRGHTPILDLNLWNTIARVNSFQSLIGWQ